MLICEIRLYLKKFTVVYAAYTMLELSEQIRYPDRK
jgi:hypothetical protein